jgi:hypothetical protein
MAGGTVSGCCGCFVIDQHDPHAEQVFAAATLDSLFAADIVSSERLLLKLDIEGHEIDEHRVRGDGSAACVERGKAEQGPGTAVMLIGRQRART